MLLAVPIPGVTSTIGLQSMETMLWHGVGGVLILLVIVLMTLWRGYQRFVWRREGLRAARNLPDAGLEHGQDRRARSRFLDLQ
jgi:uncharacterized membrane protein